MASRRPWAAATGASLLALVAIACQLSTAEPSAAVTPERPNVLMVVTDDQPTGMTKRMPTLRRTPGFVRFNSYYDNNPLCCPTRSTLLTGLYSHHHGVETNRDAPQFDDGSTLATWLDGAGYETGLFGKYLNAFPWGRGRDYVPPGWDRWSAFTPDASYYDYTLLEGGSSERHGKSPADYSTDVLADKVDSFIRDSEDPFFAYFAPYAPHAPRTPAPRHRKAFANANVKLPPNFNRVARGATRWWKQRKGVSAAQARKVVRGQWRSLLAVDEAIARFLRTLEAQGEAEDTVVIFVSDNGYSIGSHRYQWKDCPYEECIHLPMMIRWPGHTDGGEIGDLVGSIDLAPTIAEIAGAQAPGSDGRSLVPLLEGSSLPQRPMLLRHVHYGKVPPTFWGVRDERYTFVEYANGERELYDNERDRHQLTNLAGRPGYEETEGRLRAAMTQMRGG